jgi:hypothetical protein
MRRANSKTRARHLTRAVKSDHYPSHKRIRMVSTRRRGNAAAFAIKLTSSCTYTFEELLLSFLMLLPATHYRQLDSRRRLFGCICRYFCICLGEARCLLPERTELGMHKFVLNSKCFFKIFRLTQLLNKLVDRCDIFSGLILQFFDQLRPARRT